MRSSPKKLKKSLRKSPRKKPLKSPRKNTRKSPRKKVNLKGGCLSNVDFRRLVELEQNDTEKSAKIQKVAKKRLKATDSLTSTLYDRRLQELAWGFGVQNANDILSNEEDLYKVRKTYGSNSEIIHFPEFFDNQSIKLACDTSIKRVKESSRSTDKKYQLLPELKSLDWQTDVLPPTSPTIRTSPSSRPLSPLSQGRRL